MSVPESPSPCTTAAQHQEVVLYPPDATLYGDLCVPATPRGVVLFAHGSGSSRHSPRNRYVAGVLQQQHLATLLMDLLEPGEEQDRARVFDIPLLAKRFALAVEWVAQHEPLRGLPVGYFGASTGAAVALQLAAQPDAHVDAVVSRGGRPDLAGSALTGVQAPVLLIVGGNDPVVLDVNRDALARIGAPKHLAVVPDATHLFSEPGTLEEVARLAADWFTRHLGAH